MVTSAVVEPPTGAAPPQSTLVAFVALAESVTLPPAQIGAVAVMLTVGGATAVMVAEARNEPLHASVTRQVQVPPRLASTVWLVPAGWLFGSVQA